MITEFLTQLVLTQFAATVGITLAFSLRQPVRSMFGSRAAYHLWIVPLLMAVAVLLPSPHRQISSAPGTEIPSPSPLAVIQHGVPALPSNFSWLIAALWFAGVVVSGALLIARQRSFSRSLGTLYPFHEAGWPRGLVHISTRASFSPAVVGLVRPKIVLPADFRERFTADEQDMIIAHELVHLRFCDPIVNATWAAFSAASWFNPLVRLALTRMRLDQELACDAEVVDEFPTARRTYAEAMIKSQIGADCLVVGCAWEPVSALVLRERILRLQTGEAVGAVRFVGLTAVAIFSFASSYGAWALQPQDAASSPADSISSTPGILRLHVGRGISVRSTDGRFACADKANCTFDPLPEMKMELQAEGSRAVEWRGCNEVTAGGLCVVKIGSAGASVEAPWQPR